MSIVRFLLIIVGVAAYFGLAVVGAGGVAPFLYQPALRALAIITFIFAIVAFFAGGNVSSGIREDRGNRWVLIAFTLIGLLTGFLPAWCDRHNVLTFDGDSVRWLGVALYTLGSALRIYPVFVLGNRFSGLVAIQPGHALVTTGIYSVIRHPSYLGLIAIMFGWGIAFRSWVGVLLAALMVPVLVARIRSEERLLSEQFGEQYAAYRARTSRLIPGLY